jgi:NTP pyrophosphatase (non-canonical NTP hydrolase)
MDLKTYQEKAAAFDTVPHGRDKVLVPLMGLVGEVGELLSEYKRELRAQQTFERNPRAEAIVKDAFTPAMMEELGDILWYVANLATKFDFKLDDIADVNLKKLDDRYAPGDQASQFFDDKFQEAEQIPRRFEVIFIDRPAGHRRKTLVIRSDGRTLGDEITDNAHIEDGYRFHDVFHLSYATMLGWSPVTRKFMRIKRGTNPVVDEVEDGGRSWVFEEAVSLMTFEFAKRHNFFANQSSVDGRLLRDIKNLTTGIEVHARSRREWELAILAGYNIFRKLREHNGGWVQCDLQYRAMSFRKSTPDDVEGMIEASARYGLTQKATIQRAGQKRGARKKIARANASGRR